MEFNVGASRGILVETHSAPRGRRGDPLVQLQLRGPNTPLSTDSTLKTELAPRGLEHILAGGISFLIAFVHE